MAMPEKKSGMFLFHNQRIFQLLKLVVFLVFILGCGSPSNSLPPEPDPVPPVIPVGTEKTDVVSWVTSPDQLIFFKKQTTALNFSSSSNYFPSILVDTTQTFQSMDGFGFTVTGGSAMLINQLASNTKEALINELFRNDSTFIGINYLRISIGASDLDEKVFSYDDMPLNQTDPELKNFSIDPDKPHLIPILKSVIAINPGIKILGSPWSAPAWMKTNQSAKGGSLKPEYYAAYANYLVKYIKAMQSQGIRIDAITPQNEPLNPNNNPSMTMSATEQADFIKNHLGPAFQAAAISTKIIVWDHNCDVPSYPLAIRNDPGASKYVDGSAFHL